MANEHRTVLLSIFATLLAALVIFAATVVVSGGIAINLVKGYVFPLILSAFTLAVFAGVLFANSKGKIPGFGSPEPPKEQKSSSDSEPTG